MKSLNLHNIKLLNHVSFLKTDFFVANYKSLNITCSSLWHTSYSNPGSRSYISNYRSIILYYLCEFALCLSKPGILSSLQN